ncbi:(E2-independent) E3 ubiquitin-conjugating enzyme FATS isoform X1 [Gambusia affinis]|uniref:(E2-independent) E3 ubiquitin-conjugating enzyme FATS isoform X1 n=1 Tax=Gambusia affinis TaxID=33528 RepID=UPI001CDC0DFF|nr:(E2-independent) E3 ubiquitin-conjugating enzyme FATS isoform X1 [Gambusia affinis]
MTLRRPAAHPRRAPGWRRSGDESHWENFMSGEESLLRRSLFSPAPRPQSAIEGRQLDFWLEHLKTMQSQGQSPIHNTSLDDRTASMPVLEGQAPRRAWKQTDFSSFSAASSSCGSSPSSQESLQTVWFPTPERKGGWEKAHIVQSPSKEQTQFSYLAPVKTGWLPIQRRVMTVGNTCTQNQHLDASGGQVKLKQPITPAFQKNDDMQCSKAEAERSHTSPSAPGVKTRRTTDRGASVNEGPEKLHSAVNRLPSWNTLRTGWKPNRASGPLGGNNCNELTRELELELHKKSHLITKTITEPTKRSPLHCTASADPTGHHSWLQGSNTTNTQRPHTALQKTSSIQPLKATVFYGTNNSSESSHIQTSSAAATLIPQNKAGISSITISSRKVSRSASLPGSRSRKSPSPLPPECKPMDPNSQKVRVQRKATIVKVTEQRVISSSTPDSSHPGNVPSGNALDTVVRRRKATIIKVTEHKESYSPGKITPRNPEYRHSYTEGLYKNNSMPSQENHMENSKVPAYHLNSSPSATVPNTFSSDGQKNETMHRSTLKLFLSNPPAIASSVLEPRLRAAGQRSERPQRPLSCYGSLTEHSKQKKEGVSQYSDWKQSSGLPQDTSINHVDFDLLFTSSGKAAKEEGVPMAADRLTPNRNEKERLPPTVDGTRRASPSLTLIKAPDPDSHQSQEEVLALNAAAIIANIKLQRQLSKKKTPSGDSERASTDSPQGNAEVMDERKSINSKKSEARHHKRSHAEFISLRPDHDGSTESASLQGALQRCRPVFISRSQERVQTLARKVQERRERSKAGKLEWRRDQLRQLRAHSSTGSTSVNDNLSTDGGISQRDVQFRSKRRVAAPSLPRQAD